MMMLLRRELIMKLLIEGLLLLLLLLAGHWLLLPEVARRRVLSAENAPVGQGEVAIAPLEGPSAEEAVEAGQVVDRGAVGHSHYQLHGVDLQVARQAAQAHRGAAQLTVGW